MTGLPIDTDVTDTPALGRDRFGVVVGCGAVGLGLFAFVADLVLGVAGWVLVSLTSSGFAWGLMAFLVGRMASTRRRAAIGGAVSLAVATLLYYLLVLMVSRRWSGAYVLDPATGIMTPSDLYGLRSLAVTAVLWLVGSVTAGPLLSLLGHTVRSGAASRAALVGGGLVLRVAGAVVASRSGRYVQRRVRPWRCRRRDSEGRIPACGARLARRRPPPRASMADASVRLGR
jgi:hypothetical protein